MIFWVIVFIVSLALMVKSSDWLLEKAEKIGLALGISPFIVGVTIVGMGTSFPELISGLMAVWEGATEIVVANAVGSNVANIFLVVGVAAVVGRKLVVAKNLIDLDLPLLAISTCLALSILIDRQVTFAEAIVLLVAYVIYLFYTMQHKEEEDADIHHIGDLPDILSGVDDKKIKEHVAKKVKGRVKVKRPKISGVNLMVLLAGMIGLFLGSKYLIESVIEISQILDISAGIIAISAVAIGTSLPELLVSVKAARQGKAEIAIGNIFGSNVFNLLLVIGVPGLIKTLVIDEATITLAVPAMVIATFLFIVTSLSKKIHIWEGLLYLLFYVLFLGKLFGLI